MYFFDYWKMPVKNIEKEEVLHAQNEITEYWNKLSTYPISFFK